MNFLKSPLPPGLYLVATPIGTARDVTLRALDVLASAEILVAEDTRTLRKLMDLHDIPLEGRPLRSYHDHSREAERGRIIQALTEGRSVAYASEAGTPLIADPGYALVRDARAANVAVTAAPGPSAIVTALSIAGLPTDSFHFAGFLPTGKQARRAALAELSRMPSTLVLYEAPNRVAATLAEAADVLGTRDAALCRELTKRFEEVWRGSLHELAERASKKAPKGECVILVAKAESHTANEAEITEALKEALTNSRLKDAVQAVAGSMGAPRREVYQLALSIKAEDET